MMKSLLLLLALPILSFAESPYGLASGIAHLSACMMGSFTEIMYAITPSGFLMLIVYKFIQIEKKREQSNSVYADEIAGLFLTSIGLAVLIRFVLDLLEYYGVPSSAIINVAYFCNPSGKPSCQSSIGSFFGVSDISACESLGSTNAYSHMTLFGTIVFSRVFIVMAPVITMWSLIARAVKDGMQKYKEGKENPTFIFALGGLYIIVIVVMIVIIAKHILKIVGVDYGTLSIWFVRDVLSQLSIVKPS